LDNGVTRTITDAVERFNSHAKTCDICVQSNVTTAKNYHNPS
jgi:hypothetical protein